MLWPIVSLVAHFQLVRSRFFVESLRVQCKDPCQGTRVIPAGITLFGITLFACANPKPSFVVTGAGIVADNG